MNDSDRRGRELLAGALGIEPDSLDADTQIGKSPRWDSLAHMRLILAIEADLGRNLTPDQIVSISSLADVILVID